MASVGTLSDAAGPGRRAFLRPEHGIDNGPPGMNTTDQQAEARLKPSFIFSLAIASYFIWIATATYADAPAEKQAGTTGLVVFLSLLLGVISLLSSSSRAARGFVFSDSALGPRSRRISMLTGAYSLSLPVMYFLFQ